MKLNQEEEAAKLFIQAIQYNSEDEQALGNVALGHFLLRQYDQTKETCGRLLEKNPVSTRAYLLLVLISEPDEELKEVINKVPESLRSSPEIAYAIGQKAHEKGNITEAKEWTERALNHDKEASPEIKAVHAGMIIESVLRNESAMLQGQVRQTHKEDLERAKNLISDAWDSVSDTDLRELRPNWILNRGLAKKLLGDTEGAILDTEIALSIEHNNPLFLKNRALLARIIGTKEENERAINLLTKIVSSDQTPEAALILVETLLDENRALEAKGVIEGFLTNDAPIELKMGARRLQVQIYIELGHFDRARELAQGLIHDDPSNILSFVVASQVESIDQKKDAALALLNEAHKLAGESTRPADLLNLANEFYALEEFEKAAGLYNRITNTEVDSYLTRRLLSCYYNWGKLDVALDICTRLRSKYGPLRFVSEIESVIYEETNDLPKAKEVCREYLSSYPDDFLMNLRLAVVCLRSKSYQEVDEFLNSEIAFDSLTVDTGLQLGQLYAARNQDLKWIKLMYELRRKFFSDARTHLYYVIQFFRKNRDGVDWLRPTSVSIDSAVEVKDISGKKKWYIIEERNDPDFRRNEITSSHPLAQKLLGKKVGDKIVLTDSFLTKEEGEVSEIKSKYIYALHETMGLYQELFPDKPGLWSVHIGEPENEGEIAKGFQVFLDQITRDKERNLEAQRLYKERTLTIGSVASAFGENILKVMSILMANPDVGIICCQGDPVEREQALSILENKDIKLVVDFITLVTIYNLEVGDTIVETFGKLKISQSTIEELQSVIDDRSTFKDRGFFSIGKEGDQFVKQEITPEEISEHLSHLQLMMDWVEANTEVVPSRAALSIPRERKEQLRQALGESSFETILIASEPNHVLFSDDWKLRSLAKHEHGSNGVWTQALLMYLDKHQLLERAKYNEATIRLVVSNYYFTSIDPDVLLEAANKSEWFPRYPYTHLLATLSEGKSDEESALAFTGNFIFKLWGKPVVPQMCDGLIYALLDYVTKGRDLRKFIRQLIPILRARFRLIPFDERRVIKVVINWSRTKIV